MAIKTRTSKPSNKSVDELADKLADKPYGKVSTSSYDKSSYVRRTITLPPEMSETLEDYTRDNKRAGLEPKTMTGLVELALREYMTRHKIIG
ncbi:hypothetical protein O4H49_20300 [Kiloniella laminariae]|uniref:Ribbon-helix-helix protein CopG domain-containing protein n=1 Tax=Kiloniella laminariae TaxID=454162 RepID=A0ABT4LT79_9PROT|nr:hypothetical protein [Kiloniella laminariae]MCZ4283137.1 hypothetical protein [Kiloniella laminariae]